MTASVQAMCRPSDLTSKPSSAVGELKQMLRLGWPTSLQAITSLAGVQTSLLYLGHLPDGPVLVAAGGIGSMFCNVAGRSLLVGFQLGCIPLMSQAFGAGNHQRIGVLLQQQWLIHAVLICTVIAPLWACSGAILSSVGQPPGIVAYASRWVMLRVPALFGWSLFMGMQAYCISQRMPRTPAAILMLSQALLLALLPLYVYGFGLGFDGVPLALSTADFASGIASLLVPIVHPRLRNGWPRLRASWRPALQNWGEMLRLSLPSALMQWSEWWAWELNLFLSGLLCAPAAVASGIVSLNSPLGSANGSSVNVNGSWSGVGAAALNSSGFDMAAAASRLMAHSAAVEGSVTLAESATAKIGAADYCAPLEAYPILSTTMVLCFTTQIGFTIAAGARVGNLMGAGDVRGAKVTTLVAMGLALTIILLTCSVLLAVRGRWACALNDGTTNCPTLHAQPCECARGQRGFPRFLSPLPCPRRPPVSPLYLPCISPVSPHLYLPTCISPAVTTTPPQAHTQAPPRP